MRLFCVPLVLVGVLSVGASDALAEPAGAYRFYLRDDAKGYAYGYTDPFERDRYYDMDRIPYYSAHPPVYYSYPVPRPYGWSPHPYPGTFETPHVERFEAVPAEMINPHVPESDEPELNPAAHTVRMIVPAIIINPYVHDRQAASDGPRVIRTAASDSAP